MITIKNIDRVDVIFQNILSVDKSRSPLPVFPQLVPFQLHYPVTPLTALAFAKWERTERSTSTVYTSCPVNRVLLFGIKWWFTQRCCGKYDCLFFLRSCLPSSHKSKALFHFDLPSISFFTGRRNTYKNLGVSFGIFLHFAREAVSEV